MEERKKWFSLEETAVLLWLERDGKSLIGQEAVEAVLKLVFTERSRGFPLASSYYIGNPLKMERFGTAILKERVRRLKPGVKVRGLWPVCMRSIKLEGQTILFRTERGGFPWNRFQYVMCPATAFMGDKYMCLFENREIARISGRARIRGLWPTFIRSVNHDGQDVAIPWKRYRYVIFPAPYYRHPFKVVPERVEIEFTGLLDIFLAGQCRREEGNVYLDRTGCIPDPNGGPDIGEIILYDPSDPNYSVVRIVPQAVQIGSKTHFIECLTIKETDLVISRHSLTGYAEQEGRLDVLERLAGLPAETAEHTDRVAMGAGESGSGGEIQKSKGGRPRGYFREALEHVYQECRSTGRNIEVLTEGQQQAFLKLLQKKAHGSRKNKDAVCEYVALRIEAVKPTDPKECVKIHECKENGKKYCESRWYGHDNVSTLMNTLRKKYPLDTAKSPS